MLKPTTLALLCSGLCSGLWACGGSSATDPPPTELDTSVWSSSVQTLVVADSGGGFVPQPPPGSTCTVNAKQFTVTPASKRLDWMRCVGSSSTVYKWVAGGRVLGDAEYKGLDPVLGDLKVVMGSDGCIADASLLSVTVTTASGQQQYVDDSDACNVKDKPYLKRDAIASALDQLNSLAGP